MDQLIAPRSLTTRADRAIQRFLRAREPDRMKIIDVHSHWGTRRGYPLQTEKELAQQRATWNSETRYHTEAEMAAYFRTSGVRAILDLGYAKYRPLDEMRALHDLSLIHI